MSVLDCGRLIVEAEELNIDNAFQLYLNAFSVQENYFQHRKNFKEGFYKNRIIG